MIYSHEVEEMCTVAQGVHHGAAPIPEEAKWVQSKEVNDISGFDPWCGLVCSAAGCLQAYPERKRGYHPGGPG